MLYFYSVDNIKNYIMKVQRKWNKVPGIYKITVKGKNKEYFYIGSSINLYERLHNHKVNLKRNTHTNPIMQNLYNKYGLEAFSCEILEECQQEILTQKEQSYIDLTSPYINITKEVIRNTPSPESSKKIADTLKDKRKKGIIKHTGTPCKKVDVYDLNGNFIQTCDSISKAAKAFANGLTGKVSKVCQGERLSTNGYQFRYHGDNFVSVCSQSKNRAQSKYNNILLTIPELNKTIYIQGGVHGLYKYLSENLYSNPELSYTIKLAPVKQDELLENLVVKQDNQQPSLDSNILEGSTTNSQILTSNVEDGNANTSVLPIVIERDKNGNPLMSATFKIFDFGDDIV